MKTHTRILSLSCGVLLLAALGFGQSYTFVTVDAPCDTCPGGIAVRTVLAAINPGGDIVGVYRDAARKTHGFLLSRGQFTPIEVPGALVGAEGTLPTTARGISPSGDIAGQFTKSKRGLWLRPDYILVHVPSNAEITLRLVQCRNLADECETLPAATAKINAERHP
jgi:hypothetical protein